MLRNIINTVVVVAIVFSSLILHLSVNKDLNEPIADVVIFDEPFKEDVFHNPNYEMHNIEIVNGQKQTTFIKVGDEEDKNLKSSTIVVVEPLYFVEN